MSFVHFGGEVDSAFQIDLKFVVMLIVQTPITIDLHCAEIIINITRDEDVWGRACTIKGTKPRNAFIAVVSNWQSMAHLCSKVVNHWLFGLAMTFVLEYGIVFRLPQTLYLLTLPVLVVALATYFCFKQRTEPLQHIGICKRS